MINNKLWAFFFCALALVACGDAVPSVTRAAAPYEAGKIYKILGTHTSISDKAWVREFFSDIDESAANAFKPYIKEKVTGEIAQSFSGNIPAILRTEIIYTNYGNANSKLLLGIHGTVRARLTLIDPYTGITYKEIFASGVEGSAATTLGRVTGRFGAFAARVIHTTVKGKETTEQRLENVSDNFANAAIRNFNRAPEKVQDPNGN